jgi:hypothetical protein
MAGGGALVDGKIRYLNTDLDLKSGDNLTALAAAFKTQGIFLLHVTRDEDGLWYATFETDEDFDQPDPNITVMIAVVESLVEPIQSLWSSCILREFNIGYDCGSEPWAFNQGLSSEILGRMAAVGASLRITLYSKHERDAGQSHAPLPAPRPVSDGESSPPAR